MDVTPLPDATWLLTLRATERARFLALVARELTVVGRQFSFSGGSFDKGLQLERMRQLNQIQHQVIGYICFALGNDEDAEFLPGVISAVLEPRHPDLREATIRAWAFVKRWYVATA